MDNNRKKKNFQIQAFSFKPELDSAIIAHQWKILEHAIHTIYSADISGSSPDFEELYRYAYNMVLHKSGEMLYSGFVTATTNHVQDMSKSIEAAQGDLFLREINRKWTDYNKALQTIRDILMYMERTFVASTQKTPVLELGLNLWRDNVIHSNTILPRLQNTVLELILHERMGEFINRGLMRNIIKMLVDLGPSVYQEDFEKPFLEISIDFYRAEAQKFFERCDCGEYLKKAERHLNAEIERVGHYLDAQSEAKIMDVVEKEMIANHIVRLVHMENSGLVKMLLDDRYEDLGRMYNLFRRVSDGLPAMLDAMTSHIRDTGKQLATDPERLKDPVEFVYCLLNKKDKYNKIISMAFNNEKTFLDSLDSSFGYIINLNTHSPEYILMFVDDKLREGFKGVSQEDMEIVLDKVIMLVCYVQDTDVFEKHYEQHLAKRLLSGDNFSVDAERNLIAKLKTKCNYQFTSKLERMLADIKVSNEGPNNEDHKIKGMLDSSQMSPGSCSGIISTSER